MVQFSSHWHTRHDRDRTVLSCLVGGVNWAKKIVDELFNPYRLYAVQYPGLT